MTDLSRSYRSLRVLYLVTLVAIIFPRVLVRGGWIGLVTGGDIAMLGALLSIIGLAAWRFIHVIRNPQALASPPGHPVAALIRRIAVLLMAISTLASIAMFFIRPITHMLLGRTDGGEAGIGYFVVSLGLYNISGFALLAILLFELGRWIARRAETIDPTTRRRIALAALGCIALAVFAYLGARTYVHSGYRTLLAHCGAIAEPVVKRQLTEVPPSILVTENGPRELPGLAWRADALMYASGLAFIEYCSHGSCTKLVPASQRRSQFSERAPLSSPTSPIEMYLSSASVEKTFLSARLLRLRYEIRTTQTHEVLSEISEWVYDWGDWNRAGLPFEATKKDACGYAQAGVHQFRPNVTPNGIADAYAAADVRFLLSVVPRASWPANAVTTAEMLSPSKRAPRRADVSPAPTVAPLETVISESSRRSNSTPPTLPDGSRVAAMTLPSMGEAPSREDAATTTPSSTLLEDFHGPVRLRLELEGGTSEDGLTFQHCCAGALSSAVATGAAPAGRSYMEAMFIAEEGRQSAGAFTQLGVGAASNARGFSAETVQYGAPTGTLKSGEIVGVLIDTDRRSVEYYVKGQRVSIRDLHNLRTTELGLWLTVSAGHGGAGSSDRWVVNFGAAPFVYPPTEPILTYEGRIHRL
jgi:hypothetical protein